MVDAAEERALGMVTPILRTKLGRRFRSRLKRKDVPADDLFFSVVTNFILVLQGGDTTDEGLDEVLEAGGVTAMYRDRIPGAEPIAPGPSPQVRAFMRKVSLQNLRGLVETSTMDDLVWARDLADMEGDDGMLGYAIPIILLLRDVAATPEAQGLMAMMRDRLVHFQEAASFLRTLPTSVAQRLAQGDASVLDELDPDEKRRIQHEAARLQAQAEAHGFGGGDGPGPPSMEEGDSPS